MTVYTKMVISGGGINGIAIAGAVSEFAKNNDLNKITDIMGISIGSVIGVMICIGYTMEEIENIFLGIKMEEFINMEVYNIFENYGVDNGEMGKRLVKAIIANKGYDVNINFRDLLDKTGKNLVVVGTNVNLGRAVFFNAVDYPEMPVVDAIRISSSFPLMYEPVEYKGDLYVDGAVLAPYPIDYFGTGRDDIIGFLINKSTVIPENKETHYDTSALDKFLYSLLYIVLDAYQDRSYEGHEKCTVFMSKNDLVGSAMEFKLTTERKLELLEKGKECYRDFIEAKLGAMVVGKLKDIVHNKLTT